MFQKLFGDTEKEQEVFLRKRLLITGITIALCIVLLLISYFTKNSSLAGAAFIAVMGLLYMWGWAIMRGLFGISSLGALIAGRYNIVFVVIILIAYLILGYFGGIFCLLVGLMRFIYLKKNKGGR